ncbi:hypothetical protein [Phormidium nigroviride]
MIEDPDAQTEIWIDYVWAKDEAEAYSKCQAKAEKATVDGKTLVKLVGKPIKIGRGKRYECTFEGEVL